MKAQIPLEAKEPRTFASNSGQTSDRGVGPLKLLAIETNYTWETIQERGQDESITCRDLDGFFERVWTVHPIATLTTSPEWTSRSGQPVEYTVNDRHIFVEGKIGRFTVSESFFLLNFILAQFGLLVKLYRLIRRERISVIRAGDPLYTGFLSWLLARATGIPFVVRIGANHDKFYETTGQLVMPRLFRKRRFEKLTERFVFKRADLVAAANSDYVRFSVSSGADPERVTVFAYGNLIDKRHFQEPSERQIDMSLLEEIGVEPHKFLISIGRLEPLKRPDEMVRMLALLTERGRDLKLVFAGDGTLEEPVRQLAEELGVLDRVVFAGSRNQAWIAQVVPLAAAVVAPLAGRALSEAALAAPPIVAYDIDWHKDLVETGITGELVPYHGWREMADSVEKFLDDPDYARRMGRAVRERALDQLDQEKLNEHERQEYRQLLAGYGQ